MNDINLILFTHDGQRKAYRFTPAQLREQIHQCQISASVAQCFGEDEALVFYEWLAELMQEALQTLITSQPEPRIGKLKGILNIQDLKLKTDVVAIADRYTSLQKSGRRFFGLCPLHQEKHGSFNVYPDTQSWYCFSCNRGGDVIDLIMLIEKIDFRAALNVLAGGII